MFKFKSYKLLTTINTPFEDLFPHTSILDHNVVMAVVLLYLLEQLRDRLEFVEGHLGLDVVVGGEVQAFVGFVSAAREALHQFQFG